MARPDTEDDRPSVLDQITSRLGGADANSTRVQNEPCDGCGQREGSKVKNKAGGWVLCRPCFNDPETLAEFADA